MKPTVFIMDDERSICEALYLSLKANYAVEYATDPEQGMRQIRTKAYDVLLLDMRLGSHDGMDILRAIYSIRMNTEVIVMTAHGSEKTAIEAMELGAFSYLCKPLKINELKIIIQKALEHKRLNEDLHYLANELNDREHDRTQMIGKSAPMRQVFRLIDMCKSVDSSVLVTGESGTGKELVARAIHDQGRRAKERFVVVNCAAIPEGLLESEFFGHKKGAFTGAVTDQKGKFLLADKGTLFLDEIGDMPLSLQAKILRVLQEQEIIPVGDTKTIPVDVRIIAATNRDLQKMIAEGTFREDLYYRLNVVNIQMPPLRERREDIIPLCEYFIQVFNKEQKKDIRSISDSARQKLLRYHYPGNVRQLANIIEHAAILTMSDMICDFALPEELDSSGPEQDEKVLMKLLKDRSLHEVEILTIKAVLRSCNGHRPDAAKILGISERSLYYKIKEYSL